MWLNYLKIAFRRLANNRIVSVLNSLALAVGLTVALLIGIFITHELQYDRWVPDHEQVFRVYRVWNQTSNVVWTPSPLAEKLRSDYPEVISASGLSPSGEKLVELADKQIFVEHTAAVDSTFFQVVSLPFAAGDPETALSDPKGMVISTKLAEIIFGEEDPLGQTIRLDGTDDYFITGIISLEGRNSHLAFDLYRRFEWYSPYWSGNNRATYVKVNQNSSVEGLEGKVTTDVNKLVQQELAGMNLNVNAEDQAEWRLQPFAKIHLHSSEYSWIQSKKGNIEHLYIFGLIAVLVLLVAIFNYVNLATAQATQRGREIGVRKVTGAMRSQLVSQFLTESILIALVAGVIAIVLTVLLLPVFNEVVDRTLTLQEYGLLGVIGMVLLTIITGILAGTYPALVISGYRPVEVMQKKFFHAGDKGLFRKVLVTSQFAITITLLLFMAFIYKQIHFMNSQDLGFDPEQIITIPLNFSTTNYSIQNRKNDLLAIPGVEAVSVSSRLPGKLIPDWTIRIMGREEGYNPYVIFTDPDFAEVMDLNVKEGRYLDEEIAADSVNNFVVNETLVREFQIDDPIGAEIKFTSDTVWGRIVGVVEDFNFHSLTRPIRPLVMGGGERKWFASVRLNTADLDQVLASIRTLWQEIEPTHPMRFEFLDEEFAALYEEQSRFGNTVLYSGLLTLLIALLGLFGLTMFSVQRRVKEIGIRKILGASVSSIVKLISLEFILLIIVAFLIAVPVSFYIVRKWLENFAYQTDVSWWLFPVIGLVIIIIAMITASVQSVRAANLRPATTLRSE